MAADPYTTLGVKKDATPDEIKKAKGKKAAKGPDDVFSIVPETGLIEKEVLIERTNLELGMGEKKVRTCINTLVREEKLFEHEKPRPKAKPQIFLSRFPAAAGSNSSAP